MKYQFTNKLPSRACKLCGCMIPQIYSDGGVGAVCQRCAPKKDAIDLVVAGVIRNITIIPGRTNVDKHTFSFEANIDGDWYQCAHPCGNWCMVEGWLKTHEIFSVPVGWWELEELYNKHRETEVIVKRCHSCENELNVYRLKHTSKAKAGCPVCENENTYIMPVV